MKKLNFFLSLIFAVSFISCVSASVSVAGGFNGNLHDVSETIQSGESIMFVSVFTAIPSLSGHNVILPPGISETSKSCASVSQYSYYCNYTVSSSAAGSYSIRLTGTDSQGNVNSTYLSLTVTSPPSTPTTPSAPASNSPPAISSIPNQNVNENSAYSYQVSVSDDGDSLTYSLSGAPSGFSISSSGLISGTTPSVNSDTPYTITVSVSDGHNPAVSTGYTLTIKNTIIPDTTPPVVSIISPTSGDYKTHATQLTYTASDNVALASCWYSLDGGATTSAPGSCSGTFSGLSSSEGSNTWIVYAKDTSGNIGHDSVTFTTDTTKPVITILGSNPDKIEVFSAYSDAGATAVDNVDGDITSKIQTTSNVNANVLGNYSVVYAVSDNAGNAATATRNVEVVDDISPIVTLTAYQNSVFRTGNLTFLAHASDNYKVANVSFILNGAIVRTDSSGINDSDYLFNLASLSDGVYNESVVACDTSGNCAKSSQYNFTVDSTAPSISFISPSDNSVLDQSYISINIAASDFGSGLKNVTAKLYDSSGNYITQSTSTFSPLVSTISGLSNGVYYLNATAFDLAGNFNSTKTIRITLNKSSGGSSGGSSSYANATSYSYGNVFTPAQEQINQTAPKISLGSQSLSLSASDYLPWVLLAAVVALLAGIVLVVLIRKRK